MYCDRASNAVQITNIVASSILQCDAYPLADLSSCCGAGHRANPIPDGLASAECGDDGQAGAQQLLDATEHSVPG